MFFHIVVSCLYNTTLNQMIRYSCYLSYPQNSSYSAIWRFKIAA